MLTNIQIPRDHLEGACHLLNCHFDLFFHFVTVGNTYLNLVQVEVNLMVQTIYYMTVL